ncbi:MAG: phytanoyl-CoA dioxygenase family protein [Planctomycetota bacterium]|jgi:ectoine hydroxylase-related dioxygenase (phytanoyl-CoA dioxygenase family)|nr:phytanoyl-CoA dioxygenase family protein [Planctomycetota bacterium]
MTTATVGLDTPLTLSPEQIASFRDRGFIHLREVLPPAELSAWRPILAAVAHAHNQEQRPLEERDTYGKAFLQTTNLWRRDQAVIPFVFGKRVAGIAKQLLGTSGVRLYHDQALFKEPGGGHTPWHADQFYWPLASELTVTAWIPLVPVAIEMGPLAFSARSQHVALGRDLAISDESEQVLDGLLNEAGLETVTEAFDLGDVSFHCGWTYHRAGGNNSNEVRDVMTMIYMDADMRLAEPVNQNQNQINDRDQWMPGVAVGAVCDSPLNPRIC